MPPDSEPPRFLDSRPHLWGVDHVQFGPDPLCPSCLMPQRRWPRSRVKCWKCGVTIYVRRLDGEAVLANEAGLEELRRAIREMRPPVECVACGCRIEPQWKVCPICTRWQDGRDDCRREWTPQELDRIIEAQLVQSSPEMHAGMWEAMTPWEREMWLRRWRPGPSMQILIAIRCTRCGRLIRRGLCECARPE